MAAPGYQSTDADTDHAGIAQWLTLLVGIVFIVVGIAGLVITGFDRFAASDNPETLMGFQVNPLHNLVHLALGIPALLMWRSLRLSGVYGALLAVVYGATTVYGLFAIDTNADILALNDADNWLHLGFTVLGFAIALIAWAEERSTRAVRSGMRGESRYRPEAGGTASRGHI